MVNPTFPSIASEWVEWVSPNLKTSSRVRYLNILRKHILPEFNEKAVSDIGREDVIAFRNRLLTTGGKKGIGLSPITVNNILTVLKSILSYASCIRGIQTKDLGRIPIRTSQKHMRVFSREEQKRLTDYLFSNPSSANLGILLSLYTGLRIGELCALRWKDINLKEQDLFIHSTLQRIQTLSPDHKTGRRTAVIITEPKSISSLRHIPIPEPLMKPLNDAQCSASCFFLTGDPEKYMEPRTLEYRFARITQACDIRGSTFHTCRHTFATRCVELGFDIKSLSEILGHSNVNLTMNRYVHPSTEFKQENMNLLSTLINNNF